MVAKVVAASMAFAAIAAALPATPQGFTIDQVETGHKKLRSGPVAMAKTFSKFKKPVPANVLAAAQAAVQSGTVTANPTQYDSEYLCPVAVGTGNVANLIMDFDTGSSDFWVFSSEMPSSQRNGHAFYTPSSSSSSRLDSGETWNINYGDGSGASGNVYFDQVVIGGVTATSQAVECATSASSEFISDSADGLVGLAFDNINTGSPSRLQTFMGNVGSTLPSDIFAAWLKYEKAGAYDFGFLNPAHYTGSVTYSTVSTANGFWQFTASGYAVGNSGYSSSMSVIADTGTTLIYLPATVVKKYYASVSGATNSNAAGGYIFPCSATLPNLSIYINGVYRTVPGQYINFAPYSGSQCFGGLQSSAGIGINILGDVFLKSQYVVFDVGNTRIGFATAQ